MWRPFKRLLVGSPLPTHAAGHQRLSNVVALAVFASDALSSTAYATEEILWVLAESHAADWWHVLGLTAGILLLLVIVVISYSQTIHAYPNGGGAYIVSKDNLGKIPSLTAGAALLVDYILTAAVSIAAGVAALTSAVPEIGSHRVAIAALFLLVILVMNLRGVKESGKAFAVPTYAFVVTIAALIVWGLVKRVFVTLPEDPSEEAVATHAASTAAPAALGAWVLLRAFASGCAALTGVEAISNGVPAFRAPESDNADKTLRWMGLLLGALFLGISVLAVLYQVHPSHDETVVSQLARHAFGTSFLYYVVQGTTALILILAANTSFADFPRLASLMARDSILPRQLSNQGDRLAFSNGIFLLAFLSWALIALFGGEVHSLIPLYAVGVFLSFTLSQGGMVVRWVRQKGAKWRRQAAINAVGTSATLGVLVVVILTKFTHGAWVVCVVIPALVVWFTRIERHYRSAARQLKVSDVPAPRRLKHTIIVPVAGIHRGVLGAIEYARSLGPNVRAVTIRIDERQCQRLQEEWAKWEPDVPLVVLDSPYRSLVEPLVEFLDKVEAEEDDDLVTVVIPEFVPKRFWHRMLHNQTALLLNAALSIRPNIVVTTVRIPLED